MKLNNKVGIIVDSLGLPIREGLVRAKSLGADGVQIYAVSGEMAPENLSAQSRIEMKQFMKDIDLEISALCGDLAGHGFQDQVVNPSKIEKSKRILDLAVDLGTNIVTTHIGIIPNDANSPVYAAMQAACEELSVYARSMDAYFAVETGPETAATLKQFLDSLSTNGVSANFDPANMVMVTGDDPVAGIKLLKDYVVHTHVKDGIRYKEVDPRLVYGALGFEAMDHEKIAEMVATGEYFREVPLGEGQVDFNAYFAALQEIGYDGYLTIEREVKQQPEEDIALALRYINQFR